jgi:LysR family transcriptional regulator, regulator for bpeEF and oprC
MDRFLALTIFTRVVEKGSFVRAAASLDLAPATVTEHMQALERRVKTKLLHRTTRRLALTEEGAAYFEQCQQILARMEEADSMLTAQRQSPKGTLRVMTPAMLGTRVLIPKLPRFLDRYPELRVELTLSAQIPDFFAQNLDLALQITMQPEPGVVFRPLGLCPVCTVATPTYLKRHGVPKTPDDLDRHHVIGVRAAPGILLSSMRFQRNGRLISRPTNARLIADSGDAQRAAGLAHGGIFQGHHYAVADLLESGDVVPVLKDWDWTGPPLGAVYLPNRFLAPKIQVFLDFATKALAGRISPYRADWDNR